MKGLNLNMASSLLPMTRRWQCIQQAGLLT